MKTIPDAMHLASPLLTFSKSYNSDSFRGMLKINALFPRRVIGVDIFKQFHVSCQQITLLYTIWISRDYFFTKVWKIGWMSKNVVISVENRFGFFPYGISLLFNLVLKVTFKIVVNNFFEKSPHLRSSKIISAWNSPRKLQNTVFWCGSSLFWLRH